MASPCRVLYIGVTRDLPRRVYRHRLERVREFAQQHHVTRLVDYEETPGAQFALDRVRQIRGGPRERTIRLVESVNAGWVHLAHGRQLPHHE